MDNTSEEVLYNAQLTGWQILFSDAEKYIKQGNTYQQWLADFSPRDAHDPQRNGGLSVRALTGSNFAVSWRHKGGRFTEWEQYMMNCPGNIF